MKDVISQFCFEGEVIDVIPYGNGHINDTYLLRYKDNKEIVKVIIQKMNTDIFKKPIEVMDNIINVTSFLRKQIINNNGDPNRETMTVYLTKDNKPYSVDSNDQYWRAFRFIEGATSYDQVKCDEDFYESAYSFGRFQYLLNDYPAHTLYETICDFHNTKDRYQKFLKAVEDDVCGRVKDVQKEIEFVLSHEDVVNVLGDMLDNGKIPLRVTHNDTKLNNIMIDDMTHKGICVIDLDTVMPGLSVNDFGDLIRFGASTGSEDEKDLSKIECNLHLYEICTKGYIEGCNGSLTLNEIKALPIGAKVMTFECGMRFLTDYLQGDTYFKTHYPDQNLDRCRTQFKLVSDYEKKWDKMNDIVMKYYKEKC